MALSTYPAIAFYLEPAESTSHHQTLSSHTRIHFQGYPCESAESISHHHTLSSHTRIHFQGYPCESAESISHHHTLSSHTHILFQGYPCEFYTHFSSVPFVLHVMYRPSHTTCYINVVVTVIQVVQTVSSSFCSFLKSAMSSFNPVLTLCKPHENCLCYVKFLVLFVFSVIYLQNVRRPVTTFRRGWVALLHSDHRPHVVEFQ